MKPNTIRLIDLLAITNSENISIQHYHLIHDYKNIFDFNLSKLSDDVIEQWSDVFNSKVVTFHTYCKTCNIFIDDCDAWRVGNFGVYFENKFLKYPMV